MLCYMKREDLEKMKAEINVDCTAAIGAVERLLAYERDMRERERKLSTLLEQTRPPLRLSAQIEDIIRNFPSDFEIYDILLKLQEQTGKPPSGNRSRMVSNVINKLRQRRPPEIVVVQSGKGSRSGTYQHNKPRTRLITAR